jgi:HD superfamily phosphohydrolase
MHLMTRAIGVLRSKGIEITAQEAEGLNLAILLHDIGHGPFSHTLEQTLVQGINHEMISELFMKALSLEFGDQMNLALDIFTNQYPKPFLHQLVSSQLDMDRLDYLARDSFFTGVAEGVISHDRIINMMTVSDNELVIEGKGIYSIEKFLISRRLMYWQVYLHKTVIAADILLVNIFRRARHLVLNGTKNLPGSPVLERFLHETPGPEMFVHDPSWLEYFAQLDDSDILSAVKTWQSHSDSILSGLCKNLINRRLSKVEMQVAPFSDVYIRQIREAVIRNLQLKEDEVSYYFYHDKIENKAYNPLHDRIMIKDRDGVLTDISIVAGELNNASMPTVVSKYILYYPKNVTN